MHRQTPRIDFLTDGVFAIVATLLVLDIHVPDLASMHGDAMRETLREVAPSLLAFAFSFVTILVFWLNHEAVSKAVERYTYPVIWMNLVLLLWISLIPFTTRFISEYPRERPAVLAYGAVMFMCASVAVLTFAYIAFWSPLLPSISHDARRRLLTRFLAGPVLYLVACGCAFVDTRISLAIFALPPLLFFIPAIEQAVLADLEATDDAGVHAEAVE